MPKTSKIVVLQLVGREFRPVMVDISDVDPVEGVFSYKTDDGNQYSARPGLLYLNEALSTDFHTAWKIIRPLIDVEGFTFSPTTGSVSGPHRLPSTEYDWSFVRDSSDSANALMITKIADSPVHAKMKAMGLWSAAWVDDETQVASLDRPRQIHTWEPPKTAYGRKYDSSLSGTDIAKRIRADIKTAIAKGDLPAIKTSVRYRSYSGGQAIDATIVSWPTNVRILNPERVIQDRLHPNESNLPRYTEIGSTILKTIESIREAYNFDGSDSQTDYFHVNYYGHVQFDWQAEGAERKAILRDLPRYVPGRDAKIASGQFAGWYKIANVYEDDAGLNVELAPAGKPLADHLVVNGPDLALLQLME